MIVAFARKAVFTMLVRAGVRQMASRSVDVATDRLEERLPDSVVRAANVLPGDLMRVGGSAVIAAEAARSTAVVAKRASAGVRKAGFGAGSLVFKARSLPARVHDLRDSIARDIAVETESSRRSLMADFQRELRGEAAAINALLDLRGTNKEPLPDVPPPIQRGRRRFVPQLGSAAPNRVQRTYQKPIKAWDRPLRRR